MIEISFGKLVLLALIALIVLGPEKLPGVARTAGALLRRMRSGWDDVRAEVERELQIEEIKRNAREVAARAEAAQTELDATLQQVRDVQNAAPARTEAVADEMAAVIAGPATEATVAEEPDNATGDLFAGMSGPASTAPKEPPHGHA